MCVQCPKDNSIDCAPDSFLEHRTVRKGFWRFTLYSKDVFACKSGHWLSSASNTTKVRRLSSASNATNAAHVCSDGHTGPRCAVCFDTHFYSIEADRCLSCDSERGLGLMWMVVIVVILPVILSVACTVFRKHREAADQVVSTDQMRNNEAETQDGTKIHPRREKIQSVIGLFQILNQMPGLARRPQISRSIREIHSFSFVNFALLPRFLRLECALPSIITVMSSS